MFATIKAALRIGDPANDHRRSSGWERVERRHLQLHPFCTWCGTRTLLQVHHIIPFHVNRSRELDPTNLLTLCMSARKCHLKEGHRNNWHLWDPDIAAKAAANLEFELREQGLLVP